MENPRWDIFLEGRRLKQKFLIALRQPEISHAVLKYG